KEISVVSIIGPRNSFTKQSSVANHASTNEENILASESSSFATCAFSIKGEHLYLRGVLSEIERESSCGYRKLLAVARTLEYYERTGVSTHKASTIYWLTDSQNMHAGTSFELDTVKVKNLHQARLTVYGDSSITFNHSVMEQSKKFVLLKYINSLCVDKFMTWACLPGTSFDVYKIRIEKEMRINGYYHLQIVVRVLDELLPTMRCDITPKSKLYRGEQYFA
ncbi:hypothetical protein DAPPUDRAFT_123009, partial [Daphnia pulex]